MGFYETIKYTVIEQDGPIEIRQYQDILLASTKTNLNRYQDSGFNNVFQYISGTNTKQTKISMTTPVVTYTEDNQLVTGFYVSSKYNKETVPKPSNNTVFINELPSSYYAVIRFRGRWTESNFDTHDQQLLAYLKQHNYTIQSNRLILRYQPPFIPGLFRRNEIAYQIEMRNSQ